MPKSEVIAGRVRHTEAIAVDVEVILTRTDRERICPKLHPFIPELCRDGIRSSRLEWSISGAGAYQRMDGADDGNEAALLTQPQIHRDE